MDRIKIHAAVTRINGLQQFEVLSLHPSFIIPADGKVVWDDTYIDSGEPDIEGGWPRIRGQREFVRGCIWVRAVCRKIDVKQGAGALQGVVMVTTVNVGSFQRGMPYEGG